jgi:hypothetical protein
METDHMTDSSKPTIGVNDFVRRQTPESEFTHYDDGGKNADAAQAWEKVVALAVEHFAARKPSYRDGVCVVPVPPEGFFTGVVDLQEGDELVGAYKARRPGEEPRKAVRVRKDLGKQRCVAVEIILYSRETLEGEGEECTGCDWDIISVNGRITETEQPIHPETLIANHFELDGGTATGKSPEEFEQALRESVVYWKSRALLAP